MLYIPESPMKFDPYKHKARTVEELAAETKAALLEAEVRRKENQNKGEVG
mgnify:CR=1 FL=1|tara:strand:+ start:97 stop:246 length:150 start_codon:yes stop_codon:yes gene_type:complete